MASALRLGEIDVGIGLTEGWIAGLGRKPEEKVGGRNEGNGKGGDGEGKGYKLVGTYVESPLSESFPLPIVEISDTVTLSPKCCPQGMSRHIIDNLLRTDNGSFSWLTR